MPTTSVGGRSPRRRSRSLAMRAIRAPSRTFFATNLLLFGPRTRSSIGVRLWWNLTENAKHAADPSLQARAALNEVHVSAESGDLERVEAALLRANALAEELDEPYLRWVVSYFRGTIALLRGDLTEAERLAGAALQIGGDAGQPDAVLIYSAQIGEIRLYQGRGEELVELIEKSAEASPAIAAWRAGLAWYYCWLGRTEEAATILEEAARDGFAHLPHNQIRFFALAHYAEAASETL